jgi:hypothetical protein
VPRHEQKTTRRILSAKTEVMTQRNNDVKTAARPTPARFKAATIGTASAAGRCLQLGGVFGAENALEARAGELDADEMFTWTGCVNDVDYASRCGEVGFGATRSVARKRDANFEIGANGDVEARDESSAATA